MLERRQGRRFNLRLPCLITVLHGGPQRDFLQADSKAISCVGAYLCTNQPIAAGTRIGIDLMVCLKAAPDCPQHRSCISIKGEVVRSDSQGMAVRFDGVYQIIGVGEMDDENHSPHPILKMAIRPRRSMLTVSRGLARRGINRCEVLAAWRFAFCRTVTG